MSAPPSFWATARAIVWTQFGNPPLWNPWVMTVSPASNWRGSRGSARQRDGWAAFLRADGRRLVNGRKGVTLKALASLECEIARIDYRRGGVRYKRGDVECIFRSST